MNQFSIYGAVSNWCQQFGLTEDEKGQKRTLDKGESVNKGTLEERDSTRREPFVSSPRRASGNSLRENIQDFELLSETIQCTRVCENASFWYQVSAGVKFKTKPDEDDVHQVGHPPQNASEIAKQFVGLAGHSACVGVKCFAFDSMVDLKAILRSS